MLNVLVGCERSGTVRDAFLSRGHNAWSCDIEPSATSADRHFQCDLFEAIEHMIGGVGIDLLIAHPECTHTAVSGSRWFPEKKADGRQDAAIEFFMKIVHAPVYRIAIEQPVSIMSSRYRKPDQILQPYGFGHRESKATCLWLKNLPRLRKTNDLGPPRTEEERKEYAKVHRMAPSDDRGYLRSIFPQGFADAMADQWGALPKVR